MDLVGIDRPLSQETYGLLADKFQLDRSQIAIGTSHTHTGPVVGQNLSALHYRLVSPQQQALIDQNAKKFPVEVVNVVEQAIDRLAPSQLTCGSGAATFAVNRRNNREQDVATSCGRPTRRSIRPRCARVGGARCVGTVVTAVVFEYACHSTVLSFYQRSGDYPGFAQLELKSLHPGCLALFFADCGADQNPLPRRSVELAQHYGRRLCDAVDGVLLTSNMKPVATSLTTNYRKIDLPLDSPPDRAQIERDAQSDNKYVVTRAKMLLEQLGQGVSLSQSYPYPIGTWTLGGDVQFITLGGEVVVDSALRLKSGLSGTKTWVAAYANDVIAYIPSRRVLHEGGCEGGDAMLYYGLPAIWAPAVENAIVDEVHQ